MLASMATPAFKEWAVVVRALLAGEQILDVRKGGLRETDRHFAVRSDRCWLYPTVEHQRPELLKPAYRRWVADTQADAPAEGTLRIDGWAELVGETTVSDPAELEKLDGKFIWTLDYAASRLQWKQRDPLWILAVRAHRLEEPITVEYRAEYGGCTSWVDLEGLPDDPTSVASEPVLTDESFAARLRLVEQSLGRPRETTRV
jgi:hypothetical protein